MNLPRATGALFAMLDLPAPLRAGLHRRLGEPGRAYHGFAHLALLWRRHCRFARGGPAATPRANRLIAAAILYHDAILRPGARDNETRSAALWRRQAPRLHRFSAAEIGWVATTIEASARHLATPAGRDAAARLRIWFLDLDLTPLGEAAPAFRRNGQALRREAQRLGPGTYEPTERCFLSTVAAAPAILRSPRLHAAFERQARANIAAALGPPAGGGAGGSGGDGGGLGSPLPGGIRDAGYRRDHGDDGRRALRQPRAHHDRRARP